jgi:homeobox protein cut-like
VKEIEASWTAVVEEKQENWEAKERSLEEKVENQERLLREIKASYEVSQRLGRAEDVDTGDFRTSATAAELEIVSSDLERTSLRLAEMETRNEQLELNLRNPHHCLSQHARPRMILCSSAYELRIPHFCADSRALSLNGNLGKETWKVAFATWSEKLPS